MKKSIHLRKLLLLVCIIFGLTGTTQTINTEWATKINQTFAGIDKNRVPHGLLRDYAMEFTDLTAYNGVLTDSTDVDIKVLGDIYKTVFMANVTTTFSILKL